MKSLTKPTDEAINDWLSTIGSEPLTFEINSPDATAGFFEDHFCIRLGTGSDCYKRACNELRTWKMIPASMVTLTTALPRVTEGSVLAVTFRAGLLWTTNPCRIVNVTSKTSNERESFSIAYATLPTHVERGWEQFMVELNHEDDSVWYSINVYSRPEWWPVWLALPYVRYQQRRFRHLSGEAMLESVQERPAH